MSHWRLEASRQFDKAARKINPVVLRRVKSYAIKDPRQRGKGFTAGLSGYWRYRRSDWRVVVETRENKQLPIATGLGHR